MSILWTSVVAFLALYGFLHILLVCVISLRNRMCGKARETYTVITVQNQQDTVEGIVRSVVWKRLSAAGGNEVPKMIIVDLGSDDETPEILKRLETEYEFIQVMNKEEYIQMVQEF